MSTMHKPDDQTGGGPGEVNPPSGSAPASTPSPPSPQQRRKQALLLLAIAVAVLGLTSAGRAYRLNKQRADATQRYDEARRYSAAADTAQRTENLEQLFAASGARIKVLRFTDKASRLGPVNQEGDWTSRYEAEVEFLNDCQLQESLAACWSPDTSIHSYIEEGGLAGHLVVNEQGVVVPFGGPTRGPWRLEGKPAITQFKQGERPVIKGVLAIDGFSSSLSVEQDGTYRYTTTMRGEIGSKAWWFEQNRIPTGRGSDVVKPPGSRQNQ